MLGDSPSFGADVPPFRGMGSSTCQEVLQDSVGKALNLKHKAVREAGTETDMNMFVNRAREELERKREQKGKGANPGGKSVKMVTAAARAVANEMSAQAGFTRFTAISKRAVKMDNTQIITPNVWHLC